MRLPDGDVACYLPLSPEIPEVFEARIISTPQGDRTVSAEDQFKHTWGLLQRQREITDRVFNIRANRANLLVYESLVEENRIRLERDDAHRKMLAALAGSVALPSEAMEKEFEKRYESELLTAYHRRRVEGQMREAQARAEYAMEKIRHWQLEIRALRATFFVRGE